MSFPDEYRASSSSWEAVSAHPSPCLKSLNSLSYSLLHNILTLTLRMSRPSTVPPRVDSLVKHAYSKRFATRLLRGAARDNFGSTFNLSGKLRAISLVTLVYSKRFAQPSTVPGRSEHQPTACLKSLNSLSYGLLHATQPRRRRTVEFKSFEKR